MAAVQQDAFPAGTVTSISYTAADPSGRRIAIAVSATIPSRPALVLINVPTVVETIRGDGIVRFQIEVINSIGAALGGLF